MDEARAARTYVIFPDGRARCPWPGDDPLYLKYHDTEWGFPVGDDKRLFEKLSLEGFQSGLSWRTILMKRENFRAAFAGFDFNKIAKFTQRDVNRLLKDAGIVRHRGKIEATIGNARAYLDMAERGIDFSDHLWSFVGGEPIEHRWKRMKDVPAVNPVSETLSKDLKKRGFRFVGSTIIYAYMQAIGMVNDHLADCFVQSETRARS